jgi:hypothetical protein
MKSAKRLAVLGLLCLATPLLMGGCDSTDVEVWDIVWISIDAALAILSIVL